MGQEGRERGHGGAVEVGLGPIQVTGARWSWRSHSKAGRKKEGAGGSVPRPHLLAGTLLGSCVPTSPPPISPSGPPGRGGVLLRNCIFSSLCLSRLL